MLPRRDGILGGGGPAAQSTASPVALLPPATRRSTALATTVTAVLATAEFPTAVLATAVFPTAVLATAVLATALCATAVLATAVLPQLCSCRRVRVVCASTVLQRHGRRFHGGCFYVTERMEGGRRSATTTWRRRQSSQRMLLRSWSGSVAPSRRDVCSARNTAAPSPVGRATGPAFLSSGCTVFCGTTLEEMAFPLYTARGSLSVVFVCRCRCSCASTTLLRTACSGSRA